MSTLFFNPSAIIPFKCPHCNVSGKIKGKNHYPDQNFQVICPKCKKKISVKLNKRNSYRKRVSIDVFFSLFTLSDRKKAHKGRIIDISRGGMGVELIAGKAASGLISIDGNKLNFLFTLSKKTSLLKSGEKLSDLNPT